MKTPQVPKRKYLRDMKISQLRSSVENSPVALKLGIEFGFQVTTIYSPLTDIYVLPEILSYDLSIIITGEHFCNKKSLIVGFH